MAVSRPDVTSPFVAPLDMATSFKGEAEDISEILFSQEVLQKRISQLGAFVPRETKHIALDVMSLL